ncbi:uncharacterized protein L3040_008870 [Drepanopeziza brunnea f. sp. 'multigermtubi']|uniref:uncharacterized protein n=1 Tax=Drepanopeziza brunnea f. sp. 'multigermtubi' TaxID=698441 RepID=UPI00239F61B7|nr:hypothetical protein L3040_008870 [Drepanopeziza brunnea f. sp. 'multigermtubi']
MVPEIQNKSNRLEECLLTGPFDLRRPGRETTVVTPKTSNPVKPTVSEAPKVNHAISNPQPVPRIVVREPSIPGQTPKDIMLGTSSQMIIEVATVFCQNFPELAFLHLPTYSGSSDGGEKDWVHIAAMFALCHRLLPGRTQAILLNEADYASYARDGLRSILSDPPRLVTVQSLLIMSMFEWGAGNGAGAWMHSGTATRMMQSIDAMKSDSNRHGRDGEIHNRTFWACFVMDRLIVCGKSQPLALPLEKMAIDMPIGDQDFAFGGSSRIGRTLAAGVPVSPSGIYTMNEYYWILIKGFDIWSKILDLIISGGRRLPDMSKPENCPWVRGSPWRVLYDSLEEWRGQQSERLRYSETGIAVHVSLGCGEKFAFVNLLYYVSVLFLTREYIPFLPNQESEPEGPVDPPLLESTAPPGWWEDRAKDLFDAAASITSILRQMELLNTPFLTPFAGFCSFSAGTMNLYSAYFPRMDLNRNPDAFKNAGHNFEYLNKFKVIWKMGNGWSQTLKHTQNLYLRLNQDRARFFGKTRSDFTALEASIHDCSGVPPAHSEEVPNDGQCPNKIASPHVGNGPHHAAALSLQELSNVGYPLPQAQEVLPVNMPIDGSMPQNELVEHWEWPMWGEQQFLPFAVGGMPFDFAPDQPPY